MICHKPTLALVAVTLFATFALAGKDEEKEADNKFGSWKSKFSSFNPNEWRPKKGDKNVSKSDKDEPDQSMTGEKGEGKDKEDNEGGKGSYRAGLKNKMSKRKDKVRKKGDKMKERRRGKKGRRRNKNVTDDSAKPTPATSVATGTERPISNESGGGSDSSSEEAPESKN